MDVNGFDNTGKGVAKTNIEVLLHGNKFIGVVIEENCSRIDVDEVSMKISL